MSGPLAGIRVVDLTTIVLGPVATQLLGDMGAEVIKVETPDGDAMRGLGPARHPGMAAYFLNVNRNKKSLALDLKRPAALDALLRLAATADVFVHNMRPSAAARLGIDYQAIAAISPRIVYAWASGYRPDSAARDRPAFDDVIQGESGLAAINAPQSGSEKGAPRYVPAAVSDKICGQALASAVGMALFHRERTGEGQEVHVPMMETMAAFNLVDHLWHGVFGEPEKGLGYPRMFTPYRRPYATRDGHVCLLATTDRQWRGLFGAIDRPEMADDPRFATIIGRTEHIDELYTLIAECMRDRTTADWRARLDQFDVPSGGVNDLQGLVADPYLRDTGFFQPVEHPSEGHTVTMAIPTRFYGSPGSLRLAAPRLGEHNAAILGELGFSAAEIAEIGGVRRE
ncbi:MAG TPA: CoA transferase [Stellaceae bacterium]|jgi:crotonobetainyl-CoA:carnitine CoA-transferase CaiB-like acyl-CoA transferase|nr:CoA transferase [Stellaceae bacterium]